ncbi:hypothetical protein U8P80_16145 [Rhizobium beringeri]|jgi:hypothetical protein|nr:hypothetical protein U8P80_16145 [Rhizobium beringeri]WSH13261.1 hypothetical protein U8P74_16145 [Rhizobium beringeri]
MTKEASDIGELPVTIEDVARMEPQLHAWSEMAARAYGFYSGINEAIKKSADKWPAAAHHASDYRQEMALMAIIRLFATMDRGSRISFQSVYRYLQTDAAIDELSNMFAAAEPPSSIEVARGAVTASVARFFEAYRAIDFKAFGRIQSFRNGQVAHISWPEIKAAKVTYSDLETLLQSVCVLAGELKLMLTGCNDWPSDEFDDSHRQAYGFWLKAIEAEASRPTRRTLDRSPKSQ